MERSRGASSSLDGALAHHLMRRRSYLGLFPEMKSLHGGLTQVEELCSAADMNNLLIILVQESAKNGDELGTWLAPNSYISMNNELWLKHCRVGCYGYICSRCPSIHPSIILYASYHNGKHTPFTLSHSLICLVSLECPVDLNMDDFGLWGMQTPHKVSFHNL